MPVYLDYCASAPIDKRVLDVMCDAFLHTYGNADSRTHIFGSKAKELVEKSRRQIAGILQIDQTEIIFTSGATESDNMAILGLQEFGELSNKRHLITTSIEHKAVLEPMKVLEKRGFELELISPDSSGRIDADTLLRKVRPDTLLVSVMHVNNETGIIQPIEEIGKVLDRLDVLFHIDAAQSFGKLNGVLRNIKYNMMSLSGHKIHGPQGIGALVVRRKNYKRPPLRPLFFGGQQEFGFRPGTTSVANVTGFATAAVLNEEEAAVWTKCCLEFKRLFFNKLTGLDYQINGDVELCLPNVVNISFNGIDAEAAFTALKDDYAFSNGSACTSGSYTPSHVLEAMGLDENRINEALRISWDINGFDCTALVRYIKSTMDV
jgi:cysteine desulfurase